MWVIWGTQSSLLEDQIAFTETTNNNNCPTNTLPPQLRVDTLIMMAVVVMMSDEEMKRQTDVCHRCALSSPKSLSPVEASKYCAVLSLQTLLSEYHLSLKLLLESHSFSFAGLEYKTFGSRWVNYSPLMPALKYYSHIINTVPLQVALAPSAIHRFAS